MRNDIIDVKLSKNILFDVNLTSVSVATFCAESGPLGPYGRVRGKFMI